MPAMSTPLLPGHRAPAAGFDAPFELLAACHERVERSLALLRRLVDHAAREGADAQARQAARDVLRYFDEAAPHHHEDEERHVFPRLLATGDAALAARVHRLQADHLAMAAQWQVLRPRLQGLAEGETAAPAELAAAAAGFAALYEPHLRLEDEQIFPAARALCDRAVLAEIGAEMAQRRGATPPRTVPPG